MIIKTEDLEINYRISGPKVAAKTAVILQGWGTSMEMYDSVANAINDRYRVVQFDLPGFGQSEEPKEPWNVDRYADFVCSFLADLGVREMTLIGHSYGGRVILKLAARSSKGELPFAIDKIVLVDSAGVMPVRTAWQNIKVKRYKIMRSFLTSKTIHSLFPEVIDYWMSKQGSDDYRAASPMMKKCLVMAVNEDLQDIMPLVKQKTLIVWGDLDMDTPIGDAHIMDEKIPDTELVILEGTDHFSFLYKPAEFAAVLRAFLGIGQFAGIRIGSGTGGAR